jgi:succinate-semialdehyde dehydrogenase / glutarate-semialdehyde dehydrogenase
MKTGATLELPIATVNPTTGEVVRTFEPISEAQLERRLRAAAEGFAVWRRTSFVERARLMMRAAEVLESEKHSFGQMMTVEMGKPLRAAIQEAEKCAWGCRYYAEHAERLLADEVVKTNAARSFVRYQPLGPVLAIMP